MDGFSSASARLQLNDNNAIDTSDMVAFDSHVTDGSDSSSALAMSGNFTHNSNLLSNRDRIEIARCKNLLKISTTQPSEAHALFDQHVLSFTEFQQIFIGDANALYDNDIVFRINGR
jgi:hypothetical protein